MKIWLICRPCDDPYYDGHPTKEAYSSKEAAEARLIELNGSDPHLNWEHLDYYVSEVELK